MEYVSNQIKERLYSFLVNFRAEIILIGISCAIFICSLIVFIMQGQQKSVQTFRAQQIPIKTEKKQENFMYVDIAGAVEYPDVYKIAQGTRLKHLVTKAGGFSATADLVQIAHNMNMAEVLTDQQKIYIPQVGDTVQTPVSEKLQDPGVKLSLNRATNDELTALDGVGDVTAKKIVAARPYKTLSELLSRKIVSKGLYDKIKELITL